MPSADVPMVEQQRAERPRAVVEIATLGGSMIANWMAGCAVLGTQPQTCGTSRTTR